MTRATSSDARPATAPVRTFELAEWQGEMLASYWPEPFEETMRALLDPANAVETIHWGRNYLFRAQLVTRRGAPDAAPIEVVVKQFRNTGLKNRLRRALGGTKARRSWTVARAFEAAGLATAPAVAIVESLDPRAPGFFITELLEGAMESRHLLRAMNAGTAEGKFPGIDAGRFLDDLGATLARMHDAGFFHRDLSIGNVLLVWPPGVPRKRENPPVLHIIDLNRCRVRQRVGLLSRTRDLCRLTVHRREDQRRFLSAYWQASGDRSAGPIRTGAYLLFHYGFRAKLASKRWVRGFGKRLRGLKPRSAHAHIPDAPQGAGARDKSVWDPLSHQPHQHASRLEKLAVRLGDSGSHARAAATALAAAPRILRRYRRLMATRNQQPIAWPGVGVCVRPHPSDPDALLAAVADLGVEQVLLRLEPWQDDHDDDEALARALAAAGYEVSFALPQNRALVTDGARWRAKVTELADRFTPYGRHFQVGQAVNRSKWGIWRSSEYLALAATAAEILRQARPDVQILGPAVIDFELHATAILVNAKSSPVRFDGLASLLYVDRRGAPENTQIGFDTVGKVALCRAIAETARHCGPQSWITEVNWPLWEGPHSPAGRAVSVDEESQANYLARFYLLALGAGLTERVFWWQAVAAGYGLIDPRGEGAGAPGLRRRPSFHALATLGRLLRGARFLGPMPALSGTYRYRFATPSGDQMIAAWSMKEGQEVDLPAPAAEVIDRDGGSLALPSGLRLPVGPAIRYARIVPLE
jgi:tRNA A-37 threonylcarbamoyl transferase component Bud32